MLQSGGRARNLGESHTDAREDQPLDHGLYGVGITPGIAFRGIDAFLYGGPHHLGDILAVIFAVDEVRDPPIADADVFGNDVPHA